MGPKQNQNTTEISSYKKKRLSFSARPSAKHHQNACESPTCVFQEELQRALDAVEETVYDHVVNVFHVGPPFLRGRLPSEQLQIFL